MDFLGIGVIIGRYKKIFNEGGWVLVINISLWVKKIFDLFGLNKIIGIYDMYEEVLSFL